MITLFGGSFDPIHLGHLRIAEDVREYFSFEKVVFVPSHFSPLKYTHSASPEDRLQMLNLATLDNPHFEISDYEIKKVGKSYTVETISFFKGNLGYNPGFVVGSDAFLTLKSWKEPENLLNNTNFIVVVRGDDGVEKVLEFTKDLNRKVSFSSVVDPQKSGIYLFSQRRMDISSTEVRDRVKRRLSIKYLVPEKVEKYIKDKGLYSV
ncbi:MAG: nicotinate (nicotinamide) nucleotide adenylyltransferase [Hydrogenothermaceae bacterium]|nr:nicotinate (nicotinamide) nucleotide adenylyltransferase [Hydrogenothermaceae bacterium]